MRLAIEVNMAGSLGVSRSGYLATVAISLCRLGRAGG
jgi:hypothetical protein